MKAVTQGQSAVTADKERKIAAAYTVSMRIASARFGGKGFGFWSFDANAGCGWNDKVGVPGSPLVFWHAARENLLGMTPHPFFCDKDPAAMSGLWRRLGSDQAEQSGSMLFEGDNDDAIEVFAERIRQCENPKYAVGTVLIDPNGYFYKGKNRDGAPVQALEWFCREFPRIDLILNLNIRMFGLSRKHQWGREIPPPRLLLDSLGKQHWLVGRQYKGQQRFILAIGRNVPTGDHVNLGLHNVNSAVGRDILARAESDAQSELIYDLSDVSGIPGASGFQGGAERGDAARGLALPVRRSGHRGSSSSISTVGHVRRAIEPAADLSPLPLFSGGKR